MYVRVCVCVEKMNLAGSLAPMAVSSAPCCPQGKQWPGFHSLSRWGSHTLLEMPLKLPILEIQASCWILAPAVGGGCPVHEVDLQCGWCRCSWHRSFGGLRLL